jgi:alanine racemase
MEAAIAGRPTRARIDLDVLVANFRAIAALAAEGAAASGRPAPAVVAVVKANAYGHGAVRVALALQAAGAPMLACADIEEAVALREAGVTVPILVFGALSLSDVDGVFTHGLTPTVATPSAAVALEEAAARRGVRLGCHVKIDTGMNRLGFRHDNLRQTLPPVAASPHLQVEAVFTHFATADVAGDPAFDEQRARFDAVRRVLAEIGIVPGAWHAANSAAIIRDARAHYDAVRPGLVLYGVPPLPTTLPVAPVMSLTSRVVAVKGIRPGEGVSYGLRFRPDTPRTIAVVPCGYADGIDVRLGGRGAVLVRGRRAPFVGAVCMDMFMIDVTGFGADIGDEVVIIGRQGGECVTVSEMAATIGTIPYELLCRVGHRIERVYE